MNWLPEPGTVLVQRYRLEKQLGRGAHGVVFRAQDLKGNSECAVKVFHPDLLKKGRKKTLKILRERSELKNPRLLPILDVIATKNTVALVEPLLKSLNIRESARLGLDGTDAYTPLEAVRLLTNLKDALECVHSQSGHCNLKPENIFVSTDGYLLAHAYHLPSIHTLKWSSGQDRLGHHYLAPEQIVNPERLDPSVDTFALAMVVGEVLAGGRVKDGLPLSAQTALTLPDSIDQIFTAATSRVIEDRPDLKTFARDLSEALVLFTEEDASLQQDITLVSGVPTITDEMAADLEAGFSHDEVLSRAKDRRQDSVDREDTSPDVKNTGPVLDTTQPLPNMNEFGEFCEIGTATALGGATVPSNSQMIVERSILDAARDWEVTFELAAGAMGLGPPGLAASISRRDTQEFEALEISEPGILDDTEVLKPALQRDEVSFADMSPDIEERAIAVEKVLSAIDADSLSSDGAEDDRFLSIDVLDSIPEAIHEIENHTIEIALLEEDGDFDFEELQGDEAPITDELEAQVVADADSLLADFDGGSYDEALVDFDEVGFEESNDEVAYDFDDIEIDEIDDDVAEEIAKTVTVRAIGETSEVIRVDEDNPVITDQLSLYSRRLKHGTEPNIPLAKLHSRKAGGSRNKKSLYLWSALGIFVVFSLTTIILVLTNDGGVQDGLFLTQRGADGTPTLVKESVSPAAMLVSDEGTRRDESIDDVMSDSSSVTSDPGHQTTDRSGEVLLAPDVAEPKPDVAEPVPDLSAIATLDVVNSDQGRESLPAPDIAPSSGTTSQVSGQVIDEPAKVAEVPAPGLDAPNSCSSGYASVDGAFCMQTHEFPGAGQKPKTRIKYEEAEQACMAQGARLCSLDEFKQACVTRYPYGKRFRRSRCNVAGEFFETVSIKKSGAKKKCVSPHGIFDLSGNVTEWVQGNKTAGGSVKEAGRAVSCGKAKKRSKKHKSSVTGFRCCTDLASP